MEKDEIVKYDLIVIGAGPAGTPAAIEYARLNKNKKILLIDSKGKLGGECLFDGCIPSKILEVSGEHFKHLAKLKSFGIEIDSPRSELIWKTVVDKKNAILQERTEAAHEKLSSFDNIVLKKGSASFIDAESINIAGDGSAELVQFKKAIIATGSRTLIPSFAGNALNKVWDNKIFFDQMELPKDITIIGNGPSGIEFCQIFSKLGVRVNLVGNIDRILPMVDDSFSNMLLEKLEADDNIHLFLGASVKEINFNNELFEISCERKSTVEIIKSEKVLVATGRTPNIDYLNLEKAQVEFDKKGIIVNKYLQTSNHNIYAGGDVISGGPQFAHTASYEAHIMVQNLFFERNKVPVDFDKNSWVLFSDPNIVMAGISERQAKRKNMDVAIGVYDYAIDAKSQIDNEAFGFLKYIVDKKTLKIIGISIITENANSISGEAALIVANELTLLDLVDTIHPHPTLSESFGFLAKNMMGDIMEKRMRNPMFKIGFLLKKWF